MFGMPDLRVIRQHDQSRRAVPVGRRPVAERRLMTVGEIAAGIALSTMPAWAYWELTIWHRQQRGKLPSATELTAQRAAARRRRAAERRDARNREEQPPRV